MGRHRYVTLAFPLCHWQDSILEWHPRFNVRLLGIDLSPSPSPWGGGITYKLSNCIVIVCKSYCYCCYYSSSSSQKQSHCAETRWADRTGIRNRSTDPYNIATFHRFEQINKWTSLACASVDQYPLHKSLVLGSEAKNRSQWRSTETRSHCRCSPHPMWTASHPFSVRGLGKPSARWSTGIDMAS